MSASMDGLRPILYPDTDGMHRVSTRHNLLDVDYPYEDIGQPDRHHYANESSFPPSPSRAYPPSPLLQPKNKLLAATCTEVMQQTLKAITVPDPLGHV